MPCDRPDYYFYHPQTDVYPVTNPSIILRQALRAGTLAGSLEAQLILIRNTDANLTTEQLDELSEWLEGLEQAILDEDPDEDAPTA